MSQRPIQDPARWTESGDALGELLSKGDPASRIDEATWRKWDAASGVFAKTPQRRQRRPLWKRKSGLWLVPLFATAAAASLWAVRDRTQETLTVTAESPVPSVEESAAVVEVLAPSPVPTKPEPRRVRREKVETQSPLAPPSTAPQSVASLQTPPIPSAQAEESQALGEVIIAMRSGGNPSRALDLLEDYEAKFTSGALKHEALLLRLEALAATKQSERALTLLDIGCPRCTDYQRAQLSLFKAELLVDQGRCAEALAPFEQVLESSNVPPELRDRAVAGRASCEGGPLR